MHIRQARQSIVTTIAEEAKRIARDLLKLLSGDPRLQERIQDALAEAEIDTLDAFFPNGRKDAPGLDESRLRAHYLAVFRRHFFEDNLQTGT